MSRKCNKDDDEPPEAPRVARARWGLLRAALKGIPPEECDRKASIHCFPGFQLLSRQPVDLESSLSLYRQQLLSRPPDGNDNNNVESWLWAIHLCQDATATRVKIKMPFSTTTTSSSPASEQVRDDLAAKGILCRCDSTTGELSAWLPRNTDYECVRYQLSPVKSLFIRERLPRVHVKPDALASHHHFGVDNTGNTRVWDTELTLTHCLLHESSSLFSAVGVNNAWDLSSSSSSSITSNTTPVLRVLELGAGMAGLAGMALAVQNPEHTRVVLTDGHPDAVLNNRVNIQLTQALNPTIAHLNITAQRLVWTTTTTTMMTKEEESLLFDLVLACDCTHFVECHAPLALTAAHQLRIGGVALFLAPPRGDTLKRFVTLVQSLNGLFEVHYYNSIKDYSPTVSQCHDHYQQQQQQQQQQHDDETYHANIHCPHLLLLRKQRPVHDSDRQQ